MKVFLEIARLLPAIILLATALVSQALAMPHGGSARHTSQLNGFDYVVCADGELKTIRVGKDGQPDPHSDDHADCPFCIPGKAFGFPSVPFAISQLRLIYKTELLVPHSAPQIIDARPSVIQGQDPPAA